MPRPRRNPAELTARKDIYVSPGWLTEAMGRAGEQGLSIGAYIERLVEPENRAPHNFRKTVSGLVLMCEWCECSSKTRVGKLPHCPCAPHSA